ncbi:hypothetical protein ACFV2E_34750, partial [Streptomyces globisporus]|uniref:hypothetical protein n=1 Tax=Streptomyces globisporus TaxID=1908 RepID=UPI0036931C90
MTVRGVAVIRVVRVRAGIPPPPPAPPNPTAQRPRTTPLGARRGHQHLGKIAGRHGVHLAPHQ